MFTDIGHGDFKARRKLVSNKAYDPSEHCPLEELNQYIKMNQSWGYLHQSPGKNERNYDIPPAFPKKPRSILIMNVVNINNQTEGAFLGEFPVSVFNAMNSAQGVLNTMNPSATQEAIAQNPLAKYAAGDLTCPVNGPGIRICKDGQAKGYAVSFAVNTAHQIVRLDCRAFLPMRYDLNNAEALIPRVSEAEQVQTLMDCLNGISPTGQHEWELLRAVFGQRHNIPQPPQPAISAPSAAPAQTLGSAPGAPQATQSTIPGAAPVTGNVQPPAGGVIPGLAQTTPPEPAAQQPAPPVQQPAPPVVQQPPAPPVVQQPAAPAQQAPAEQPQTEAPVTQEQAPAQPAAAEQPAAPAQQEVPAGVPGVTQSYDEASFLNQLKQANSGKQG
jgi:hypothetical protein